MALAFVVLKQSFANDPVVNDPPEPSTKGTINFNGFKYKTVLSPNTGKIWLDRNLGAKRVATSSTDTDAYGTYYQFGAAKCPVGFGVPTEATKDTEKVTNLGTALDNFLRIPATGFLNDIGNDSGSGNNPAGVGEQVAMWTKDESVGKGGRALGVKNDWVNREKVLIAKFVNSRVTTKLSVRCVKD
ncbi:hypothetical protein BSPLISOX_3157 [uncultured Gammaproteobacteria bacterium]|nr:hypothetical protein [uncultured Gammaproteobacteria bacterium]VVH66859.1 hypothetical protein BSPLISOX_3157 [uncultured Gammaproteobacteria bacterium]